MCLSIQGQVMLLCSISDRRANKYDHISGRSDEETPLNSTTRRGHNPKDDPKLTLMDRIPKIEKQLYTDIFLLVPVIFIVSLLFGTIFYRLHHGWELSTSFYFSAQVLAGTWMTDCSQRLSVALPLVVNYYDI